MCSVTQEEPLYKISVSYIDFQGAKNSHVIIVLIEFWRLLEVPDWGFESSSRYKYDQLPKKNLGTKFQLPTLIFKVQRTLRSLLSGLGLWRMLDVPDWGLDSSSRYKYVHLP